MNLEDLNASQKKAVTFGGQHILVLAGAGTGKTKTIISRAAWLIDQGVPPNKIQILTFTKKAASEIVTRVRAALEANQAQTLRGSTFHSWCNQLLTKFPNLFGTAAFTIIDEDDQVSIMKVVCGTNNVQFEDIRIKPQALVDLYSFARNTKKNLTESLRIKLFHNYTDRETDLKIQQIKPGVETLLRGYEMKKKERKYLDYDDILIVVALRLQKDPQARHIISTQYEHILVDEMQDTNPLQWDLLNPFQLDSHLFCVGDDAQSIYSFRGADFKNVHSFGERVAHSSVYKLEENYRSTQEILDVSNWLLEKSPIAYDKKLHASRGPGLLPQLINVDNEWDEAYFVADKIIENYVQKGKLYSDHMILSRSGFYTRILETIFIQKKIPYITYGGRKFMESAHIKDVFSVLRVVNNIKDEIAWMRFLTIWEGVGEIRATKYINELMNFDSTGECVTYLENIPFDKEIKVSALIASIAESSGNVQQAVKTAYGQMQNRLSKKYKDDWDSKRRPDFPVLEILADNYATLGEFITESTLDNSGAINNSPTLKNSALDPLEVKDQVVISTIHSAKGLEANVCFVLNVSPKAFPSLRTIGKPDAVEEERRMLYVALTRAKNELFITRNISSIHGENRKPALTDADTPPDYNSVMQEQYFLNELPESLAEQLVIGNRSQTFTDIDFANPLDISGMDFS